jgi:hypothetical protein
MQTTLRIQDELYREAKSEAARQGVTLTRFLEDAIRMKLQQKPTQSPGHPHPFPMYIPDKPLNLNPDEIKRIDQDEQMRHELKKLGIQVKKA